MTKDTLGCLNKELYYARKNFPSNQHLMVALVEEVGELAQALIDNSRGKTSEYHVFAEAIQVATMAVRLAEEGSAEFPYSYTTKCSDNFRSEEQI